MEKERNRRPVKIGVTEGGGPPPGYKWNVDLLDQSYSDARAFLNRSQYRHLSNQVRELAMEEEPSQSASIDVRPIEDFFEIRDKGGVLGRISVRVFFFICKRARTIVILGTIKKQNNGQTPVGDKATMRRRMRMYLENHS